MLAITAMMICVTGAVETRFEQVSPPPAIATDGDASPRRTPGIGRAVVLFHGFRPQPISSDAARKAEPSYWEKPATPIVAALSKSSDVFALHYGQSATVDEVAQAPGLTIAVARLRAAGYHEIVFVGYSAGGLVARCYIEQTGGGGVDKLIQVCSPNGGSGWAALRHGLRPVQVPFAQSLSFEAREQQFGVHKLPPHVEAFCLVGYCNSIGDGIVRRDRQWTSELQEQGVPAEAMFLQHFVAMYSGRTSARVAELVSTKLPRWSPEQVAAARPRVLGLLAYTTKAGER